MAVDRCVCFDITLSELDRLARSESLSLDDLIDRTGCCTGCTSCEPYVKAMLKTGRTVFPVLTRRELRDLER